MQNFIRYNTFIYSSIILYVSILTSAIILYDPGKVVVIFGLISIVAIFNFKASNFFSIKFLIVAITFPVTLQFFGKDCFSTGTLAIFITFSLSIMKKNIGETLLKDKFLFNLLFIIIFIAGVGIVTKTSSEYWGPAARHFLNLISSIAVFILIIHSQNINGITINNKIYIEKVIDVLLIVSILHIYLSFLLINFPWIENYLFIFFNRTQDHLSSYFQDGIYTRATTVFTSGEEFGELLILLFPFALYKNISNANILNFVITASLLFGAMISGTRSSFFLILFQFLIYIYILVPQIYIKKKIIITAFIFPIAILIFYVFTKHSIILFDRIIVTIEALQMRENLATVVNRDNVWHQAYKVTIDTISLFGHGPTQAAILGFAEKNFHNLYLSMLFQFGIIGAFFILILFGIIANRLVTNIRNLVKKDSAYLLSATCLISFICFLINELKYEFNRSDSYQQIVWIIFSVFYLTGQLCKNKYS